VWQRFNCWIAKGTGAISKCTMLCEKCQKNEATVHICHASSSISLVGGVCKDLGSSVGPVQDLCPECAEALHPYDPAEQENENRRQSLQRTGKAADFPVDLPPFFSVDFQNSLLDRIERETPGIFSLRLAGEDADIEKFKTRYAALQESLKAGATSELAVHGIAPERRLVLWMVLALMRQCRWRHERKRMTREFPTMTSAELEAMTFLNECHQAVLNSPRKKRYAEIKAGEILAVTAETARQMYGASARKKLRKMGIVSSGALGQVIFQLVGKGYLQKEDQDHCGNFHIRSSLDEFLAKGDEG